MSPAGDARPEDEAESFVPHPAHDLHAALEAQGDPPAPAWLPVQVLEWLGGLVVVALAVGVTFGVGMRASGRGLLGVLELGGLSMVFLVLLGAPALALRDEHVRLELADFILSSKSLKWLQLFGLVVQFLVTVLLMYAMWQVLQVDLRRGTTIGGELRLPRMWVSGFALFGFALLAAAIVRRFVHDLRGKTTHSEIAPEQRGQAG